MVQHVNRYQHTNVENENISKTLPVIQYYYYIFVDCYDPLMRKISRESEVVVISVE